MIKIKGGTVYVPPEDYNIGFENDHNFKTLTIKIEESGLDSCDFKIDIEQDEKDIVTPNSVVREGSNITYLTWKLERAVFKKRGSLNVQIRAIDGTELVWHSQPFTLNIGGSINAVNDMPSVLPTEFEQYEARITGYMDEIESDKAIVVEDTEAVQEALGEVQEAQRDVASIKDDVQGYATSTSENAQSALNSKNSAQKSAEDAELAKESAQEAERNINTAISTHNTNPTAHAEEIALALNSYYTKSETDDKIKSAVGGVYRVCGSAQPSVISLSVNPEVGDVYNIEISNPQTPKVEIKRETKYDITNITITRRVLDTGLCIYEFNGIYAEELVGELLIGSKVIIDDYESFYVINIEDGVVYGTFVDYPTASLSKVYIIPPITVSHGDNILWTDHGFDKLAADVDLSAYYTSAQTDLAISTAVSGKADATDLALHTNNTNNPHSVTASQIGLDNVDNTSDLDKPISTATQEALNAKANEISLTSHTQNISNPHSVTKSQIGLENVDNTSDLDKPVSTATQELLNNKANVTDLVSTNISYNNTNSGLLANTLQDAVDELAMIMPGGISSWIQVESAVKRGLARNYFNIGDMFEVSQGNSTLLFDVIGFDKDIPETSSTTIEIGSSITNITVDFHVFLKTVGVAGDFFFIYQDNEWIDEAHNTIDLLQYGISISGTATEGDKFKISIPHTMTLKLHSVETTQGLMFDGQEATWYLDSTNFPSGLAVGTYNFTIPVGYTDRGGKTYQFTLANSVPSGGTLRYVWDENAIYTYSTVGQAIKDQQASCSEGSNGTALPEVTEDRIKKSRYGSNKWSESAIRQWLNAKNSGWWTPQSNFDRPANTGKVGFLTNMDSDFISVIKPVIKRTKYNGEIIETHDKVFVLSDSEMFGVSDTTEGMVYDGYGVGYSDLTTAGKSADRNRIIRSGSTAMQYWSRSQYSATSPSYIETNGSMLGMFANYYLPAVPAVVVY